MKTRLLSLSIAIFLALSLAACTPAAPQDVPEPSAVHETGIPVSETPLPPTATPTLTPAPTNAPELSEAALKYLLLAEFPDFFYCDPDFYPIARGNEPELAVERFPEMQADPETFKAILDQLGLDGAADFTAEQQLLIYREFKKLEALVLEESGGAYRFQVQVAEVPGPGELVSGQIDGQGSITVSERTATIVSCPICLAAGTLIDTPDGLLPVESLRPGMPVWTQDGSGRRVARPLLGVSRTPAPPGHLVAHLILEDGRELWVSPGHPTADGRRVGQLQAGDRIGDGLVVSAQLVHYDREFTYDLLPAGETGVYWADGILLGSTLQGPAR